MSSASTSYKKQDGTLSLHKSSETVTWKPVSPSGAPPALTLKIAELANLQQTPASSAKVSIKLLIKKAGEEATESYVFNFTSPTDARQEQVAITDGLRKLIESSKGGTPSLKPSSHPDKPRQSEAMAMAQAASSSGKPRADDWFDDAQLIADVQLQRSLLQSDPSLRQRFDEAKREKPESISISQFSVQFWSARVHLLRSHAAEKHQHQGTYNVLSEVKPRNVDGTTRLNLSKEQIQLIFDQHPLVKRVYNEVVPGLSEMEFWSRFFVSRLFKKLKGERITDNDSTDPKLDRYLNWDEAADNTRHLEMQQVPHFLDLEGNEQNHSRKQGNQPDLTMRPNSHEKVPILRVLNSMSEKMMADVAPVDREAHGPVGMDEKTFESVRLQDLHRDDKDNRIKLNIREQTSLFNRTNGADDSGEASFDAKDTHRALETMREDLESAFPKSQTADLEELIGVAAESEEDSEEEDNEGSSSRPARMGGRPSREQAGTQILNAVEHQKAQADDDEINPANFGLSDTVYSSMTLTHNTTMEFLRYFWTVFLSGDAERAGELQGLVESLNKSLDRIKAVADAAEAEREAKIQKAKKQIEEYQQRTGKRRKFDKATIKGGAKVVNAMLEPLVGAIAKATGEYRAAYETQMAQSQAASSSGSLGTNL